MGGAKGTQKKHFFSITQIRVNDFFILRKGISLLMHLKNTRVKREKEGKK